MIAFCIAGIHNGLTHKKKPSLYVHFKHMLLAIWLVQKKKRNKGRPPAELKLTPLPSKSKCNQHHVRHKIGWNRSHAKLERKKRALTAMPQ